MERFNKEIRRRIKVIHLRVVEINDRSSQRSLRGFYKCMDDIREMFQKRYPS